MELNNPSLSTTLVWAKVRGLFPKNRVLKEKNRGFTLEKSGKHYLNQVLEISVTNWYHDMIWYHLIWCNEKGTSPQYSSPNLSLSIRKTLEKPKLKDILRKNCLVLLKTIKVIENKDWETKQQLLLYRTYSTQRRNKQIHNHSENFIHLS